MPDDPVENPTLVQKLKPSESTVASVGYGAIIATVTLWALNEYLGFDPPPEISGNIGVLISGLVGYFFHGGKSEQTV